MAVVISEISASQYIGSPIVYAVTPTGAGAAGTFYRVHLTVTVNVTGFDDTSFEFSAPCHGTTPVNFDISSALRAAAEQWKPTASPGAYPNITFALTAYEEWMYNGNHYDHQNTATSSAVTTYLGALMDIERLKGTRPTVYSRKPTSSPEIGFVGKNFIKAGATTNAPAVDMVAITAGAMTGANVYGITAPADGYEIRFLNSLGVHENIFVRGASSRDVNISTDEYVVARQETLTEFSRRIAIKQNDFESWRFSTGALDKAWVSWFAHEFLTRSWMWINIDNTWVPCHLIPEETTSIYGREDTKKMEIHFTLKLGVNGIV